MTTHKVDELEGPHLDEAVALALGWHKDTSQAFNVGEFDWRGPPRDGDDLGELMGYQQWSPSTDWCVGGPLIQEYAISLAPPEEAVHRHGGPNAGWGESGMWTSTSWRLRKADGGRSLGYHETSPLIAAMRLLVHCKLGEEVTLP